MLRELHISNLAVISDARIELRAGLNCFTGATGAGKSLVIGAIEVLLGMRSPGEMLRRGANEGRVSGVFEVADPALLKLLDSITDTDVSAHGGEILLTRRLYASGRTSVSLNGNPITLAMLKAVAEHLVDVHGQHDHQYLLRSSNQLDVLDHFGALTDLRARYHDVFSRLQQARNQLADLQANRTLRQQQLDLYRFQADEIDAASLDSAEHEELKARATVLANLEKLKREASSVHAALYAADSSVVERVKMMAGVLSELATLDHNLKPPAQTIRDATIQLEDAAFDLGRYLDRLDLDPAELVEANERLNVINRILSKYGNTVEDVLIFRGQIATQIAELERAGDNFAALTKQLEPLSKDLKKLGNELSEHRKATARKLAPLIESQLGALGMEKAKFEISLTQIGATSAASGVGDTSASRSESQTGAPREHSAASGFDAIEFIVQTNPGLSPHPLRKIASGGELSRIMLALKGVIAQGDRVSVLVFDEIDANVGGRLGAVIGQKLRQLAVHHQVLCITHLPQIACYADQHLTVRKQVVDDQTRTTVRTVEGDERLEELAEMIGGERITETTRAQARELLSIATAPEPLDRSVTPAPRSGPTTRRPRANAPRSARKLRP
ncbi:DNA repair protein RecN [soil metagenome]